MEGRRLTWINLQKSGNNMSGSEMAKAKESAAEIMRQKQAAGKSQSICLFQDPLADTSLQLRHARLPEKARNKAFLDEHDNFVRRKVPRLRTNFTMDR
jgi:hypothetical protein